MADDTNAQKFLATAPPFVMDYIVKLQNEAAKLERERCARIARGHRCTDCAERGGPCDVRGVDCDLVRNIVECIEGGA